MAVTDEEVRWCYRVLLGREPESEEVVKLHRVNETRDALVRAFMGGAEFAERHASVSAPVERLPIDCPPIRVDSKASGADLAVFTARIRDAWRKMGAERPHFSVLTAERFLPEHISGSIEDFWSSGEAHVRQILATLERFGFGGTSHKTCVEFGSGVGRLTMPLGRRFQSVYGYDISSEHLHHAKLRAAEVGARNVRFLECAGNMLQPLEMADLFCSFIVFQHNPPPVMRGLVENALRCLNGGGIAMFQLPTYIAGYHFDKQAYLAGEGVTDMEMHCLPQSVVFDLASKRGCEVLEVREDSATGDPGRYLSNTFIIRRKRAWWSGR